MINPTELRIFIYDWILTHGLPPRLSDVVMHFGVDRAVAADALSNINIGKTVLPNPRNGEIWMAGPFSAVPTPYEVFGDGVRWYANCAWDMLGIAMISKRPVRIQTRCTDCNAPMEIHANADAPPESDAIVHFLVPAARWYIDIGFT